MSLRQYYIRKRNHSYRWIALAGATIVYFVVSGIVYSYGVFLPVICDDLGLSRSVVAAPATLAGEITAVVAPIVGISVVKFGARKNMIYGTILLAAGVSLMYFVNHIWQLIFFRGVLITIGVGFSLLIPTTTVATNWFVKRRGLALGIITASGGLGGFIFPLIIVVLISGIGWRWTWVSLGGMVLLLGTIIGGLLMVRNKPQDMVETLDTGITAADSELVSLTEFQSKVYQTQTNWTTKDAVRTPVLWLICVLWAANSFALSTIMLHHVAHIKDLGFSSNIAAISFGLVPGMSIIGRVASGILSVRFEIRNLVVVFFALQVIALIVLTEAKSIELIYLYAVIYGVSYGALITCILSMISAYFGQTNYAKILGWVVTTGALFGALAPIIAGYIYDLRGSYNLAFIILISIALVGLVSAFFAQPPKLSSRTLDSQQ
ncbi:MFS transporter [Chloroflexota bacterium]